MFSFHTVLLLIHVFAMLSWLGAMYFNLVLLFPMYRARGNEGYAEMMQAQGARAAPLLYLLIALTLLSGVAMSWPQHLVIHSTTVQLKLACLVLMAACHLYGSFVIWPRVFFALGHEKNKLFFAYKISMLMSASAGTLAIILTYLK